MMARIARVALMAAFVVLQASVVGLAETTWLDYVDPQYHFGFKYPEDWVLDTRTQSGKGGEMRAAVRDAESTARAVASIGKVDKLPSKATLQASPERERIVDAMMEMARKQIYEKTAEALHGTNMIVSNKQVFPSDAGILFNISTLQTIKDEQIVIAGMHMIPFDQNYMISFIMMSPFKLDPEKKKTVNTVLTSFRMVAP